MVNALNEQLAHRILSLPSPRFGEYPVKQRGVIKSLFLFFSYHLFTEPLNAYVELQAQAGEELVPLECFAELRDELIHHGFEKDQIPHYISLFYQLRRAWTFIDRGLVGKSDSMRRMRMRLWKG